MFASDSLSFRIGLVTLSRNHISPTLSLHNSMINIFMRAKN